MVDMDTFLTTLYVMVSDFCKSELPPETRPGPEASLSRDEAVTLAIVGQWGFFESERGFYRYVERHLRAAFPTLPDRTQFNRLMRWHQEAIVAFGLHLADRLGAHECSYQALDKTAVAVRNVKRAGSGWLAGQVDIGWSNRLGWIEGFALLISTTPSGVITGFGFGPASTKDVTLAETFLAMRHQPHPRLTCVGARALGPYVADKGFTSRQAQKRWRLLYRAEVVSPPYAHSRTRWPTALRHWFDSIRQIVETVYDKLLNTFRLSRERPHNLSGFQARLAAKVALHNFCIWLNHQLDRPYLAFADLLAW
jgi:hypothetical protein